MEGDQNVSAGPSRKVVQLGRGAKSNLLSAHAVRSLALSLC